MCIRYTILDENSSFFLKKSQRIKKREAVCYKLGKGEDREHHCQILCEDCCMDLLFRFP